MSRQSGKRYERVFGLHAVCALLEDQPQRVRALWVLKGREDSRMERVLKLAKAQGCRWQPSARATLDRMVEGNHQGVVAEVTPQAVRDEAALESIIAEAPGPLLLLVLDGVTDPHNLGACLRSAEAAGAQAVIAPRDRSAPLNAVAVKVASGAAESLPYIQVTNLARSLRRLKEAGVWLRGLAEGEQDCLYDAELHLSTALVLGAEGRGLRRLTRDCCDQLLDIPLAGAVASLNVSVAAGVSLFEVVRQRRAAAV